VYLDAERGFGLIHTLDVPIAADAVEQGLWVPETVYTRDLPARFGYVRSPQQAFNAAGAAKAKATATSK
jgi:hypothetical protein